jgi:ATP-dependent helicase/nuclease subunit A
MDADRVIYGFSRNVVVAASAGTGKTHRLTCLYVMLTLGLTSMGRSSRSEACPPLAVDRIVATTFSRAAALEIRARIERSLSAIAEGSPSAPFQAEIAARLAELESPPSPAELAARAGRALASLHEARVETLHGLAADLLRRHAYGLGLSPSLQVLEESEAEALADGVIDEVLAGALDGEPSEREAAQALASACGGFFRARELIRPFFNRVDEEGLDVTSLRASDHLGAARDLYARLAAATERASASPRAQIAQAARALGAQLSAAPPDDPALGPEAETALETLFTQKKDNRNAAAVVAEGDLFELRDELSAQNSLGKARLLAATLREAKDLEAKERSVLALVAKIRARLSEEHAARGLASFGDLLRLARDGLRDHPEVAAAAKDEMDVLMVDEFQDTSLVQRDLVYLLRCRDGERAPGEDAEPEQLEGHGLFVVGDRKQSIYAFRGADVAVFNRVCGELCGEAARVGLDLPAERCSRPARADLVALSVSYRSGPAIVRFVNAFSALDFASAAGADPDVGVAYGPAEQLSSASDAEGDRVVLVRDDGAPIDEPLLAGDAPALREAFAAAALAHELTSAGGFELRDVAILARRRATIPLIEVALGRLGLPYVVAGRALFDTLEVRDLSALIRLVQDPHDRNALAHVLRGPMVALSEAALLALCTTRGLDTTVLSGEPAARPSARLDPESFPEESARLELFRARLLELRPALLRLPAADAMRTALSAFELDRVMAALPRASSRIGNLDRLLDLAGERGGSLLSFSRWLERQISSEADEPEAVVFSPEDDALRLLTIHGAKGLDFPATIVVDLASDGKVTPPPIDFLRVAGEPGARAVIDMRGDRHAKLANPTRTAARARGRVRAEAERARITYVAVTRARRVLGLIGSARTTQRKSMHKTLSDHADGALLGLFEVRASSELVGSALGAPTRSAAVEPPEAPLGGPRALAIASDVAIATTPARRLSRLSAAVLAQVLARPGGARRHGGSSACSRSTPRRARRRSSRSKRADEEPDPRDAGRAVHRVLETLPLARLGAPRPQRRRDRERARAGWPGRVAGGGACSRRGAVRPRRLCRSARGRSTTGARSRSGPHAGRARGRAPPLPARGPSTAYAVFDDRIDLVDYKLARPSATLDPYAFQLRAYALALAREAPGSRVRAGILFVGADAEPRWPRVSRRRGHLGPARSRGVRGGARRARGRPRARSGVGRVARRPPAPVPQGAVRVRHGLPPPGTISLESAHLDADGAERGVACRGVEQLIIGQVIGAHSCVARGDAEPRPSLAVTEPVGASSRPLASRCRSARAAPPPDPPSTRSRRSRQRRGRAPPRRRGCIMSVQRSGPLISAWLLWSHELLLLKWRRPIRTKPRSAAATGVRSRGLGLRQQLGRREQDPLVPGLERGREDGLERAQVEAAGVLLEGAERELARPVEHGLGAEPPERGRGGALAELPEQAVSGQEACAQGQADLPVGALVAAAREDRRRVLGDVADRERVEREIVVRLGQGRAGRQDDVGVPGRLVEVRVDRHHDVELAERALEPARARRRQDRVAGHGEEGADLAPARRLDLLGQRGHRQLAAELRVAAHARAPARVAAVEPEAVGQASTSMAGVVNMSPPGSSRWPVRVLTR